MQLSILNATNDSQLQYSRSFMTAITQSVKQNLQWQLYYLPSEKGFLYPPSENFHHISNVDENLLIEWV